LPPPLRVVQVNAVYDSSADSPEALLDQFHTLTGLSSALSAAGASVAVIQRFRTDAKLARDDASYVFVSDSLPAWLPPRSSSRAVVDAVAAAGPDIVHVNGLMFPSLVEDLRQKLDPKAAIVVQHHGGSFPSFGWGPIGAWRRAQWHRAFLAIDAVSFTAPEQATVWREAGVLGSQPVLGIVEASTTMTAMPRDRARAASNLRGSPLLLWVGRLTPNKDPLTVLDGLDIALQDLPDARFAMIYREDTMHAQVSARIAKSGLLRDRVTRIGLVPHDQMAAFYSSADLLISGSHDEGSGYAVIEAMACGVAPVITDIPSFRAIAGASGRQWTPGDSSALANALRDVCDSGVAAARVVARQRFERELTWKAIADKTLYHYGEVVDRRRRTGAG
jgi:glycosyltransferase involved in cell wall biosynthesis